MFTTNLFKSLCYTQKIQNRFIGIKVKDTYTHSIRKYRKIEQEECKKRCDNV